MTVMLRPIVPEDEAFLFRVYASTRAAEMALVDWSDVQKEAFLQMQFAAQRRHYQEYYPDATFDVIVFDNRPIGRLYVDRWPAEIRIVDITMLPEARGAGIGTRLLREILAEGERAGKPVSIHVERYNPAIRLYYRLGFAPVDEHGIYFLMQWSPAHDGDQPKTA